VLDTRPGRTGSGWVSDEYGPYIYHFNAAKQLDGIVTLPAALVPRDANGINLPRMRTQAGGARTRAWRRSPSAPTAPSFR